ncbi:hypothetical protein [Sphingomonas faeni]|uniref:hypothetical protein n=1 Tax=Sphingomonas faeni TaxID=185950 RepID=UPI0033476314
MHDDRSCRQTSEGVVETMPDRVARPIWTLTNPDLMIVDTLCGGGPLNPRAVIGWQGDTRGLVAGGPGYLGHIG